MLAYIYCELNWSTCQMDVSKKKYPKIVEPIKGIYRNEIQLLFN